jgi:hypothetical protein
LHLKQLLKRAVTQGVYIFWDDIGLYVGKSVDIEKRIRQHGKRVVEMVSKIPVISPDAGDLRKVEQFVFDQIRDLLEYGDKAVRKNAAGISNKINPIRESLRKVIDFC